MDGRLCLRFQWQAPTVVAGQTLGDRTGDWTARAHFSDLIAVRFLDVFLQHGVSWKSVRIAALRARDILQRAHPFSTRVFKTDGRDILAEIARPGSVPDLLNLVKNQWEFDKLVGPMLYAGLEFNQFDEPERWWR